uniref:Putative glutamate receptor 1-like aedes albopictus n=1 Tax=Lutzomyia longipalpis TaxID=7200 RepID=A0A1B0CCX3_LUTLO
MNVICRSPGIVFGGSLNVTFMGKYEPHINNGNFQLITEDLEETFEDYVRGSRKKHLDSAHRFTYTIVTYVKDMFNFSMPTMHSKSWGYPKNGTFDGMIGFLMRGEAELGGSPGYIREERARVVDFTVGIWITRPCFIFRHPFKEGLISDVFIIPFTKYVWISIATVGVIWISFAGYIMYWEGFVENTGQQFLHDITEDLEETFEDYVRGSRKKHLDSAHRFTYTIVTYVKDMFNFSMPTMHSKSWGYPKNGTFDGMIGFLMRGEAELGGSPGYIREERARVVDFTVGIWITRPCFIFRHPFKEGLISDVFIIPFTKYVWISIATVGVIWISFAGYIMYWEGFVENTGTEAKESPTHVCAGSIAMQILVLFAFFTFQYYSASIVGSLLMEKPKTIKTLRNLIDSNLELGAEDILYTRDFFVRTTDPVAQELFRKRIKYVDKNNQEVENFLRPDVGMPKVKKGGYAFHIDVSAAYKIIRDTFTEREICDLVEIDLFPSYSFMMISMVRKGSPYRKMMIYGMRKTVETGVAYRTKDFYQTPQPKCTRQMKATDLIVNVERLFSAHALLICGFLLSLIVLSVELLYRNLTNRIARRRH